MVTTGPSVLLVVPPFQTTTRPALGVSQLSANLREAGISCDVLYLSFAFAERIGIEVYEWISGSTMNVLLGEFIFSDCLFHRTDEQIEQYVDRVLRGTEDELRLESFYPDQAPTEALRRLMDEATDFCRGHAAAGIAKQRPLIVGMTSSFQQNCAALAVLKRVRALIPHIVTMMGGANCQAEMGREIMARFDQVDYVGQGECDLSIVQLCERLLHHNHGAVAGHEVPGFIGRGATRPAASLPLSGADLDRLPIPDFDPYFSQLAGSRVNDRIVPGLVLETARGCWWGAKQHCTFCGLNGEEMSFRSKSPARARDEIEQLAKRHGVNQFAVADNILDMKYFRTLLPMLSERPVARFFFETKSNLSREQVRLLARCGIDEIQPGIESLSDRTLKLMRKGCTRLQNLQLLKWSAEAGVSVAWNYLFGFPGEGEDELDEIADTIATVHHLQPPVGTWALRLDRFSPYFNEPGRHGLDPVGPAEPYRHVYPFDDKALSNIAYFHRSAFFERVTRSQGLARLKRVVAEWQRSYQRSWLVAIPRHRSLLIVDTRRCARRSLHCLTGLARRAYELCDKARAPGEITQHLGGAHAEAAIRTALERLVGDRLMARSNGRYLSLAIDVTTGSGKLAPVRSAGFVRPRQETGKYRRRLAGMLRGRESPVAFASALTTRAGYALHTTTDRIVTRAVTSVVRATSRH
ncbi:MAG: hypothetical protein CMJ18_28115 [Phycisphaeraceae bacterium]|nr:hypothetical protein [Phycisphaeraceae bacterium]